MTTTNKVRYIVTGVNPKDYARRMARYEKRDAERRAVRAAKRDAAPGQKRAVGKMPRALALPSLCDMTRSVFFGPSMLLTAAEQAKFMAITAGWRDVELSRVEAGRN